MRRRHNWEVALTVWASGEIGRPYEWGETDCASLVRRAHLVMYDVDLFADVERWSSLLGARKAVEAYGSVGEQLRRHGAIELPMAFSTQGDVIVHPGIGEAEFTGSAFVLISGRLLSANPDGLVTLFDRDALLPGAILLRMPR